MMKDDGRDPSGQALAKAEPQSSQRLDPSGFDPSRDQAWHRNVVAWSAALREAFPKSLGITRLQVAQAIATEIEQAGSPRFGEPDYQAPPQPLHAYRPHRRWPWFCADCGYPEHERLKHLTRDSDGSGSTEGDSAGRNGIAQPPFGDQS